MDKSKTKSNYEIAVKITLITYEWSQPKSFCFSTWSFVKGRPIVRIRQTGYCL